MTKITIYLIKSVMHVWLLTTQNYRNYYRMFFYIIYKEDDQFRYFYSNLLQFHYYNYNSASRKHCEKYNFNVFLTTIFSQRVTRLRLCDISLRWDKISSKIKIIIDRNFARNHFINIAIDQVRYVKFTECSRTKAHKNSIGTKAV